MACERAFKGLVIASALVVGAASGQSDTASQSNESEPLMIAEQGGTGSCRRRHERWGYERRRKLKADKAPTHCRGFSVRCALH